LVYEPDWTDPKRWIMGQWTSEQADRKALKSNPKNLKALVAVGNAHLVRNEERFARIFYGRALQINPKFVPALNNLAYLEGKNGNMQAALAGFKQALQVHEFELQPKHNMARIYMAAGLWRHAGLAYRQLEVRMSNDDEVLRGLGLTYLAAGKIDKGRELLRGRLPNDQNGKFAKAVVELATGDRDSARSDFASLAKNSEFAQMIIEHWKR
jgi:tetratricopeptide (TPR) repeat protein